MTAGSSGMEQQKREAFLSLAAEIFEVDRSSLSLSLARGDIPAWDSINHLRLVMESERRLGVSFSLEEIPHLDRLEDFLKDSNS